METLVGTVKGRIWGINYEEIDVYGKLFWKLDIRGAFMGEGLPKVGVNEKCIRMAQKRGVEKFIIKDRFLWVPTEKQIKAKIKRREYEDRTSLFAGSPPMRIYYFSIS